MNKKSKLIGAAAFSPMLLVAAGALAQSNEPVAQSDGLTVYKASYYSCRGSSDLIVHAQRPDLFFDLDRLRSTASIAAQNIRAECSQIRNLGFRGKHNGHLLDYFTYGIDQKRIDMPDSMSDPMWSGQLPAPGRSRASMRQPREETSPAPGSREARLRQREVSQRPNMSERRFFYKTVLVPHFRFGDSHSFVGSGGGFRYTTPSEFLVGKRYRILPYDRNTTHENFWRIIDPDEPAMAILEITSSGVLVSVNGENKLAEYVTFPTKTDNGKPECFRSELLPNSQNRTFKNGYCFTIISGESDGTVGYFLASFYPKRPNGFLRPDWSIGTLARAIEIP